MNPDTDVTYQTVNLFSSDKCFIYFISDVPHYIRSNQHNTVCTILVKVDVLDTCGAMICSYFGIAFLLFFMKIENTVYTSFQNSTLLFINGLIFDIMNIQNNQSLEFEWIPMLAPLRSVNALSMLCKPKKEGKFKCKSWIKKLINCYFSQNIKKQVNSLLNVSLLFLFISINTLTNIRQINWIFLKHIIKYTTISKIIHPSLRKQMKGPMQIRKDKCYSSMLLCLKINYINLKTK